jgi:hypothetical protein
MNQKAQYGIWEPIFAKVQNGLTSWRLDYLGEGEWELRHHIPILYKSGEPWWTVARRGGVNMLSNWGRTIRDCEYESGVQQQLGILISGSYEKRLLHLRDSLIIIGREQRCTTEGGIGTSFVCRSEITLYAELGNSGGIDIWGRNYERFVGGNNFSVATGCFTIDEIESEVENAGYSTSFVNIVDLQILLMSTWTIE